MNPKSKSATISDRLRYIAQTQSFEQARKLVAQRRMGKQRQKEADRWLRNELVRRNWWKVTLGLASIVGTVAAVIGLFR